MNAVITSDAKLVDLVDEWLQRLRAEGRLESTTINEYERVLRVLVVPELDDTSLHELTTEQINALLTGLGQHSINRQRKAKVILGAMLDAAVADGALTNNPVPGTLSISRPPASQFTLARAEIAQVHAAVRTWLCKDRPGPKSSGDMAAIIELMLATGARIGEVLALRWRDIDLDASTLEINATIKTEPGKGTYRKVLARPRTVDLPEYTRLLLADVGARWRPTSSTPSSRPAMRRGSRSTTWSAVGARSAEKRAWTGSPPTCSAELLLEGHTRGERVPKTPAAATPRRRHRFHGRR